MTEVFTSNLTKETLRLMLKENKRFDGRSLFDYRNINISYDISNKAEGSARVKFGNSEAVVGIKLGLGEPYPDSPDKGNLMVSAELLPLASPRFESGPPDFPGIELPRLVDRAIRESGMIELDKLVIVPGEKVWTLFIDIYPLNDDGNLIDASTLGAVAALRHAKIPALDKEGNIDYEAKSDKSLPLSKEISPISFSFYKLGESLILDPTREEEEAAEARITFGASYRNSVLVINSCQKAGEAIITQAEIDKMMDALPKKMEELNKKLKNFL